MQNGFVKPDYPDCACIEQKNRQYAEASKDDIITQGYSSGYVRHQLRKRNFMCCGWQVYTDIQFDNVYYFICSAL